MANINDFGKEVKKRLIDLEKTQAWLEAEVRAKTNLYVDSGYLHKIFTGERNAPKVVEAIKMILEMEN